MTSTLVEQARQLGIDVDYVDVFGQRHQASETVLRQLIRTLRPEAGAAEAQPLSLPPVVVLRRGESLEFPHPVRVTLETGGTIESSRLDDSLPIGYHFLPETSQHLLVCPERMYGGSGRRLAGVAVSLYGLRSNSNWGVGDFRDLKRFCLWAAGQGCQFVALNPLHAIHNRLPYNASPYLPVSTFFRNFLYLDVPGLPWFSHPDVQRAYAAEQDSIAQAQRAEYVDYEVAAEIKDRVLRAMFAVFSLQPDPAFAAFQAGHGEALSRFALFCALDRHLREVRPGTWLFTDWPVEYQSPDSPESLAFAQRHDHEIAYFAWLQWLIDQQLASVQSAARQAGMEIGLYHDLALATDRFGCDVWSAPEHFATGCRVGAPPDDFSPEGQDWSFPPPRTTVDRRDGYRRFRALIANTARHGGALRLDHVMRLFRLFWIPEGFTARDGTYVREPWRELLAVLAIESHRQQIRVVGEDLGTITDEIRQGLSEFGLLGFRLLFFEREGGGFLSPRSYPKEAVATATTHDLATLAGYWDEQDIQARKSAGLVDASDVARQSNERARDRQALLDLLRREGLPMTVTDARQASWTPALQLAILQLLAASPCRLLVINAEELSMETRQQNLPGSTSQYPNWRRRMKFSLEELEQNLEACALWPKLKALIADSGRNR